MKLTINWLKDFLHTEKSNEELIEGLTKIGLEVEEVIDQFSVYKDFTIAKIIEASQHPEADKLRICKVDNGDKILQIVCGAPNARAGIKVVLAQIGTLIPSNGMVIKESKIRNQLSQGMLCSLTELGLGDESNGIMELPEDYEVGANFATAYGLNEVMIELSITPNRSDCLGVYGIARDLAAAGYGVLKTLDVNLISGDFESPIKVITKNNDACPKYIGRYFQNIKDIESPKFLSQRLKSIGEKSISCLVDITNYFTFAFARPLHIFDADEITGDIIIQKAQKDIEFTALNDKTYKLNGDELCIYDQEKPLALAGVIGGKDSGVKEGTKNIFLEIGYFSADEVIIAARAHHIETDAKHRFERGVDPVFMNTALKMVSEMIINFCGGSPSEPVILDNLNYESRKLTFDIASLQQKLGLSYEKDRIVEILTKLGFSVENSAQDILSLTIPSWRSDIITKDNIVEEIARIDGYEHIPIQVLPGLENGFSVALNEKQRAKYNLNRFVASLGLHETVTCSFMNSKKASIFADLNEDLFLKNPISSELDYMRPTMLGNFLDAVKRNNNRGILNIGIFEQALVFDGLAPYQQKNCLAAIRAGQTSIRNIHKDQRKVDFFDAKKDIFAILNELGIDANKAQLKTDNLPSYYHPGRAASICLGKNILGFFGQIHPGVLQEFEIQSEVVGFEVFLDNIPQARPKNGRKGALILSDYQASIRDFAFIVDENVSALSINKAVMQVDPKLIRELNFFDIYQGSNIEAGKKSIAFSIAIQAMDRTLSEQELDELSKKVISSMEKNCGAFLRGV